MAKKFNNVIIENAEICFRDFAAEQGNTPSFAVKIPDEFAKELIDIGWPVKQWVPKNEEDEPFYLINIKVKYHTYSGEDFCAPEEVMLTLEKENGKRTNTLITEDTLKLLQKCHIKNAQVEFEWYPWVYKNKKGDGAQLERLYILAEETASRPNWADEEYPEDDEMPF